MSKKILLTGGGSGGHIYPLLAVAEKLKSVGREDIKIEYIGPKSQLSGEFKSLSPNTKIHTIVGAKIRRYFDIQNFLDIPKFFYSILEALIKMFFIMPDLVFSKGGSGSAAVILAARFYFVPIIIHESDSVPSLTTNITAKFAKKIAISFKSTDKLFPHNKVVFSGNPIRKGLLEHWLDKDRAKNALNFNESKPLLFVLGGSQGAEKINEFIINNLERFLEHYQILHQVGERGFTFIDQESKSILRKLDEEKQKSYRPVSFLGQQEIKFALNASDLVIARAGAGAIFEIAAFERPSILIPLEGSAGNHQKTNAYEYAKSGAALILEEANLTTNIFFSQLEKLIRDPEKLREMGECAKKFAKPDAANVIAREIALLISGKR